MQTSASRSRKQNKISPTEGWKWFTSQEFDWREREGVRREGVERRRERPVGERGRESGRRKKRASKGAEKVGEEGRGEG